MAGVLGGAADRIEQWASRENPLFGGPRADLLSTLPFLALAALLWGVGRELVLAGKRGAPAKPS
jgi:hypothetical protein